MQFIYTGIDKDSVRQKGKIEANSQKEVIEYLRSGNITPLSVRKIEASESSILKFFNRITTNDLVLFTRQLSSMILTGITLLEALRILQQQNNKPQIQKLVDDLISQISEGSSFSDALAQHKDVFSDVYIALIQAAEKGGLLDKVLLRLADNMEKSEDLKKKVKSALFYPGIVITGVLGVILVMNIFVIPQLGELYTSLDVELPFTTKLVLGVSELFVSFYPVVLIALLGGFIAYQRFKKTEKGIQVMDRLKLRMPVFGSIFSLSTLDETTRTLSLMISSGTSIIESLNITANVSGNYWYKTSILSASSLVEKGVALSDAFANQRIFPPVLIQMVRVGESTGKIDESLIKISEYFERDLDIKVRTLTTAIEPILIITLGITVAFLILSVITPIYSLISTIS